MSAGSARCHALVPVVRTKVTQASIELVVK